MTLSETVAIRLEEIMKEYNVTQYKLSMLSGVSQSTISDIRLKKNKSVSVTVIQELMDGLELGLDDFFNSPLFKRENLE